MPDEGSTSSSMDRRRLLALLGGGALASCSSSSRLLTSTTSTAATTTTTSRTTTSAASSSAAPGSSVGGGGTSSTDHPTATQAPAPTSGSTGPASSVVAGTRFPVRVEAGKRYLVDASGAPFLIQGDAAWSLIVQLRDDDVDRYLADRKSKGFNTLIVQLIEHKFSSNAPADIDGTAPFLSPGDYSQPNPAYFDRAEHVLRRARALDFLVLLTPTWTGYDGGDEGWYAEMKSAGASTLREYGRFLGERFTSFDNIVWVEAGDFDPPDKALVRAVAEGIHASDPSALHTAHCAPETPALSYWSGESWLSIDNIYTYKSVADVALAEYARPEGMPFFLIESTYENEHGASPTLVRTQAYQALLCGACGQIFGNNPIWHFDAPGLFDVAMSWQEALGLVGSVDMAHLKSLFDTLRWWELVPDTSGALLTGGRGKGNDRAVAAATADGASAVVYLPSKRTVTLALSRLHGTAVMARWFDPTKGSFTDADGAPWPIEATRKVAPPGDNGDGEGDWVLVLDATS